MVDALSSETSTGLILIIILACRPHDLSLLTGIAVNNRAFNINVLLEIIKQDVFLSAILLYF